MVWLNQFRKGGAGETTRKRMGRPPANRSTASDSQGALFQSSPSVPAIDRDELISTLVARLSVLETDATKKSVLALLREHPEHLGLLKHIYKEPFTEEQAPAVQREAAADGEPPDDQQQSFGNSWRPGEARTRKKRAAG